MACKPWIRLLWICANGKWFPRKKRKRFLLTQKSSSNYLNGQGENKDLILPIWPLSVLGSKPSIFERWTLNIPYPSWFDIPCSIFDIWFNLETAVGSQKSAQALGAPGKINKCLITTEVTTNVFISPCTPISYTCVLRPTAVSRFKSLICWILTWLVSRN